MLARHTLLVLALLSLTGCAQQSPPQQVNMEEYLFHSAIDDCREKVWNMWHEAPRSVRAAYFRICMENYGYDEKDYRHLWIDALD